MNAQETQEGWPCLGENDPPLDLSREEAVYQRHCEHLRRDHLGEIALIYGDDLIGVFPTLGAAMDVAVPRFGWGRWICRPITERDEPIFIPHVDHNHPSFRRTS